MRSHCTHTSTLGIMQEHFWILALKLFYFSVRIVHMSFLRQIHQTLKSTNWFRLMNTTLCAWTLVFICWVLFWFWSWCDMEIWIFKSLWTWFLRVFWTLICILTSKYSIYVGRKFHGNQLNCCWGISVWTKVVTDWKTNFAISRAGHLA